MFSLESLWTLNYVLALLPPLGIGLFVAFREGEGLLSLGEAYVSSLSCTMPISVLKVCAGSGGLVMVVETYFSVQLKSRPS